MSNVLLQLEDGSCLLAEDAPCENETRIVISAASGAGLPTKNAAKSLFQQLGSELSALAQIVATQACKGRYRGTGQCLADCNPNAFREVNVLVIVEDARADYDDQLARSFLSNPGAVILPVCEAQVRATPSPVCSNRILYRYPTGQPEAAATEVLLAAGIGDDILRVFISYRHDDCAAIAGQIFHELAERRYAVFLDRFCGAPGQDFVGQILAELFDKGILLVLETHATHQSPWVQSEVAMALAHGIGVFKVNLPGSPDSLPADFAVDMCQVKSSISDTTRLSDGDIKIIASEFRALHPRLGAARREHLAQQVDFALSFAVMRGATDNGSAYGMRVFSGQNTTKLFGLMSSARPPGAGRFREAAEAAAQTSTQAILTGPLVYQLPRDGHVTDWLGRVNNVRPVDEGRLLQELSGLI